MGNPECTEISGLGRAATNSLFLIAQSRYAAATQTTYVVFSAVVSYDFTSTGRALMSLIIKHNMGVVVRTPTRLNPNSNNNLEVFIYTPNDEALKSWYLREKDNYDRALDRHYNSRRSLYERFNYVVPEPGESSGVPAIWYMLSLCCGVYLLSVGLMILLINFIN